MQQGEWLSIVGANGSGKSTLLKLMSRLLSPSSGTVKTGGESIHERSPQWVARRIALMPQQQTI
ncbi:MAG: ABC transporter ATP-binding protein, partial [Planctomycetota bacterium]